MKPTVFTSSTIDASRGTFLASWRPYALITLAVLLLFGYTVFFPDFTYLDDYHMIVEYQHLLTDPGHLLNAFTEDVFHNHQGGMYYRPLLTWTFMLDASLGGSHPAMYHVSNILYHLLTCFSLMVFFKELGLSRVFAFGSSFFFALHPAVTQVVVWIPGRNESLLSLFILLSLIALMRFYSTQRLRWLGAHLSCFAFALLTKESALMLLPLSMLFIGARVYAGLKLLPAHYVLAALGWFFIFLYWHYAREAAMILRISDFSSAFASLWQNAWTLIPFFGTIVRPWNLFTVAAAEDLSLLPGLAGVIVFSIVFFSAKEKNWTVFFLGVCWFVVFLLPTLYRHPDALYPRRFFEHRVYLSFIGVLLMAGSISAEQNWKRLIPFLKPGFAVLCVALAGLTYHHSFSFANAMTFSEQAARTSPRNTYYHFEISMMELPDSLRATLHFSKRTVSPGEYYRKLSGIEEDMRNVLVQDASDIDARLGLGAVYFAMGRLTSAEEELQTILSVQPKNAVAQYNLGVLYYHGHFEKLAEQHWLNTLELDPLSKETYRNLCYLYYRWEDFPDALRYAEHSISLGAPVPEELLAELREKANEQAPQH